MTNRTPQKSLRISSMRPCCDDCVTAGLANAGMDYTSPFTAFGNLSALPFRQAAELLRSILNSNADVFLIASTPVEAAEDGEEDSEKKESAQEEDEGAAPDPKLLEELFGGSASDATDLDQ